MSRTTDIDARLDAIAVEFIKARKGHRAGGVAGDRAITEDRDAAMDRLLDKALGLLRKKRRIARGGLKGLFYRPGRRLLLRDWRAVLAKHEQPS